MLHFRTMGDDNPHEYVRVGCDQCGASILSAEPDSIGVVRWWFNRYAALHEAMVARWRTRSDRPDLHYCRACFDRLFSSHIPFATIIPTDDPQTSAARATILSKVVSDEEAQQALADIDRLLGGAS